MKKDYPLSDTTYEIIGAAMDVHNELGSGFLEAVYHEALGIKFVRRKLSYYDEPELSITYKDMPLKKKHNPDFLIADAIRVEIKALSRLSSNEESQIVNYLKASGKRRGLLFNFGSSSLEFGRFIGRGGNIRKENLEIGANL